MSQIISQRQIERSKKEEKFVLLTAEQVRKDFAMFGMDVQFSGNINFAYEELFEQLGVYIDKLLNSDSEKLMSLLYQIDLSEKELAKNDPNVQFETIPEIITHKILERELKKVLIRTYFKEKGQI
jgi:KaiC/GvpD/RAD55 family RecA-like ATPase